MFRIFCVAILFAFIVAPSVSCKAEDPFDLYVIIHGNRPEGFPDWPIDLMQTINASRDNSDDAARLTLAIVGVDGSDPGFFSKDPNQKSIYSRFLLYDWSEAKLNLGTSPDFEIASPLSMAISSRIIAHNREQSRPMNIHFISHSQGCYIASTVMTLLEQSGTKSRTGFVQWTALDPYSIGNGELFINSNSFFDWQVTFVQSNTIQFPDGKPIRNGISYDISTALKAWKNKDPDLNAKDHSLIHYWYHWLYRDGSVKNIRYVDPVNQHIEKKMNAEMRTLLYAEHTMVENFDQNSLRAFELHGEAKIKDGLVDLTGAEGWKIGSMWSNNTLTGDFSVDFNFVMDSQSKHEITDGADGLTLTIAPSNQVKGNSYGGPLGIEGIEDSVSVTFDTYSNFEFSDPQDPWNYISLRRNGMPKNIPIPGDGARLPEPSDSGNKFLVRVSCIGNLATIRVYSFNQDKSTEVSLAIDPPWKDKIRDGAYIAFTAATGAGYETHKIIGPIIAGPAVKP